MVLWHLSRGWSFTSTLDRNIEDVHSILLAVVYCHGDKCKSLPSSNRTFGVFSKGSTKSFIYLKKCPFPYTQVHSTHFVKCVECTLCLVAVLVRYFSVTVFYILQYLMIEINGIWKSFAQKLIFHISHNSPTVVTQQGAHFCYLAYSCKWTLFVFSKGKKSSDWYKSNH